MLSWFNPHKSQTLENARLRARARLEEQKQLPAEPPAREGIVVEELSPEEFLRLLRRNDPSA